MLDTKTKKQLDLTAVKHKRIDEYFLDMKIKPRIIIFMEDGTNLTDVKGTNTGEVAIFEKKGPNNVAININKYIAKYDFEIASKLKHTEKEDINDDERFVRQQFNITAILEILQLCSNELATSGQYYQSLWTLDGKQITQFSEIKPDAKILLVSYLPMMDHNAFTLSKRMKSTRTMIIDGVETCPKTTGGLKGNEFAVNTWKDYYKISLKRNEMGLNESKEQWFNTEHQNWAIKNQGVLELAHISAEHLSQVRDPKIVNLYMKKEIDEAKSGEPTVTMEDGAFRQKEKFKFKDFRKDDQKTIQKKRKQVEKRERVHMENLIAAHRLKQNTKMDFKTYFQFKAPNKNLPGELK